MMIADEIERCRREAMSGVGYKPENHPKNYTLVDLLLIKREWHAKHQAMLDAAYRPARE